jgi:large subunit ribosomal protein L6
MKKTNPDKAKLSFEIEIPSGISAEVKGDEILIKKDGKEIKRKINSLVNIKVEDNKIKLDANKITKRERKVIGSARAHIKNMISGLTEPWAYKLQVASVHFPTTASVDKENNEFVLKNFLGEKKDRRIKLIPGVEVKINKDIIELSSPEIERVGQAAANLEKLTKVRNRDRRIFQDGIFIIEKPGRSFI